MHLRADGKIERTDIWKEGEWLDLWSVVHLLTGFLVGLGFYFLHFKGFSAIALAFVVLVAYEMWEALVKIEETPINRMMDVVVGMCSFLPAFLYLGPILLTSQLLFIFTLVLLINVGLSTAGWRASKKAAEFEKHMRMRYAIERKVLQQRRLLLQSKFRKRKQHATKHLQTEE